MTGDKTGMNEAQTTSPAIMDEIYRLCLTIEYFVTGHHRTAPPRTCACGCGQAPKGSHSRYMPGHDGRVGDPDKRILRDLDTLRRQVLKDARAKWGWP